MVDEYPDVEQRNAFSKEVMRDVKNLEYQFYLPLYFFAQDMTDFRYVVIGRKPGITVDVDV